MVLYLHDSSSERCTSRDHRLVQLRGLDAYKQRPVHWCVRLEEHWDVHHKLLTEPSLSGDHNAVEHEEQGGGVE